MKQHTSLAWALLCIFIVAFSACKTDPKPQQVAYKRSDNHVIARMANEPDRLQPILSTNASSSEIYGLIHVYLAAPDPITMQYVPQLATALATIGTSADGHPTYTYEIRSEATWDDGSPITAADVVGTYKMILNPKVAAQRLRPYLENLRDIVVDPTNNRKLTFVTGETYILAESVFNSIVPIVQMSKMDPKGLMTKVSIADLIDPIKAEAIVKSSPDMETFATQIAEADYGRTPELVNGAGPYALESWEANQYLTLKRKANWWGDKVKSPMLEAKPAQITFQFVTDMAAALAAIQNEDIDVCYKITGPEFFDLTQDSAVALRYNFHTPPLFGFYFININNASPLFSDVKTRRALAHLVDVPSYIKTSFNGYAEQVTNPVHPSKAYYNKQLPLIAYDVAKAKSLLTEAGWADSNGNGILDKVVNGKSKEMEISFLVGSGIAPEEELALLFQSSAQQVGIKVNIVSQASNDRFTTLKERKYDLAAGALAGDFGLDDFKQVFHSSSDTYDGFNRASYRDAEADKLIDAIQTTLDEKQRNALYQQFQSRIYEQQPLIFLVAPKERIVTHKRFDVKASPIRPGYYLPWFDLVQQ